MEGVVGLHVSGKLSNTYKIAQEAANMVNGSAIQVVDSQATSMALGFGVLAAARAAAEGKSLAEVAQVAREAVPHTGVVLTVETLKYLQRGGRIGAAQAFVGGLLDMKPVLELRDGVVQPLERVRSKKKAAARLVDVITSRLAGKSNVRVAAIHAGAEGEAREMLEAVKANLGGAVVEALVADVSPTVAVHTGPGTIGLAYSEGI
jgi:DegV family protein with EDD domain